MVSATSFMTPGCTYMQADYEDEMQSFLGGEDCPVFNNMYQYCQVKQSVTSHPPRSQDTTSMQNSGAQHPGTNVRRSWT